MRISSVGNSSGLTLLELLVAMALAAMIMAISFPSVAAGLDGVRLQTSARKLASFVNAAQGRAERDQTPVEVTIDRDRNQIRVISIDSKWERTLEFADGLHISNIVPLEASDPENKLRRFMVYPGVPPPRLRMELTTARGRSLAVELNPITGVPSIEDVR